MGFQSPIKKLNELKVKPFQEGLRKLKVVRKCKVIVGTPLEGVNVEKVIHCSHYCWDRFYDYYKQSDLREGSIEDFLECLIVLKIINEEEAKAHLSAIKVNKQKSDISRLYTLMREIVANPFMKEDLRKKVEVIPQMLTSSDEGQRESAQTIVQLHAWLDGQ
jgi:hypothetical protein